MREFSLPRQREWSWLAIVVSLALHAAILFFRIPRPLDRAKRPITVSFPVGEGIRTAPMAYNPEPSAGPDRETPKTLGSKKEPSVKPSPIVVPTTDTGTLAIEQPAKDTVPSKGDTTATSRKRAQIKPGRGDGSIWIPPIPLVGNDFGPLFPSRIPPGLDSMVAGVIQRIVDSILAEQPAAAPAPKWSLPFGDDKEVAVDEKWITLGPLRVPTAAVFGVMQALGVLPKGMSAEMTDFSRFRSLQQMREDLRRAAQRSETMADFKKALADLRAERERQKEFKRNQRTPPKQSDSTERK